jgi:hypothetical protein
MTLLATVGVIGLLAVPPVHNACMARSALWHVSHLQRASLRMFHATISNNRLVHGLHSYSAERPDCSHTRGSHTQVDPATTVPWRPLATGQLANKRPKNSCASASAAVRSWT